MDDREWWSVVCALRAGRADPGVEAYSRLEPVRVQVARMRGLSDRVLRSLARDESVNVRVMVAMRPDLPADLVDDLSWDESAPVVAALAATHELDGEMCARLARIEDVAVQRALGRSDAARFLEALPEPTGRGEKRRRRWFR